MSVLELVAVSIALVTSAPIETIGIYADVADEAAMFPFLVACGYNTCELYDKSFVQRPDLHAAYYEEFGSRVSRAQAAGLKVYILISPNLAQNNGPDPVAYAGMFDPNDGALMAERLEYIRQGVRNLRDADGFVFFAGDPGGHPAAEVSQCLAMNAAVAAIIREEAPAADLAFNPWAISAWDHLPSPGTVDFWDKEVLYTRQVMDSGDYGADVDIIEFPMHNYYRSLALRLYEQAGRIPELYPTQADVSALRDRGVARLWAWPYFLIDEVDEGSLYVSAGQAQAETRYLHRIVSDTRGIGLNGCIGNISVGAKSEWLNLYAFARFCQDENATPASVIAEFAALIATPETAGSLVKVLKYIENNSTWHLDLPARYRADDFEVQGIPSPADAYKLLRGVVPREAPPVPFPAAPAQYLTELAKRLDTMAGGTLNLPRYWAVEAQQAAAPPRIDGERGSGEYTGAPMRVSQATLTSSPNAVYFPAEPGWKPITDDADWSANVYAAWDSDNLYLLFEVTDDDLTYPADWADWAAGYGSYAWDYFEFGLDPHGAASPNDFTQAFWTIGAPARGDYAPPESGYLWYGHGSWATCLLMTVDDGQWREASAAVGLTASGYTLEISIPWVALDIPGAVASDGLDRQFIPTEGKRVGLCYQPREIDADGHTVLFLTNSTTRVGWSCYMDPPNWCDINLVLAPDSGDGEGDEELPSAGATGLVFATCLLVVAGAAWTIRRAVR